MGKTGLNVRKSKAERGMPHQEMRGRCPKSKNKTKQNKNKQTTTTKTSKSVVLRPSRIC